MKLLLLLAFFPHALAYECCEGIQAVNRTCLDKPRGWYPSMGPAPWCLPWMELSNAWCKYFVDGLCCGYVEGTGYCTLCEQGYFCPGTCAPGVSNNCRIGCPSNLPCSPVGSYEQSQCYDPQCGAERYGTVCDCRDCRGRCGAGYNIYCADVYNMLKLFTILMFLVYSAQAQCPFTTNGYCSNCTNCPYSEIQAFYCTTCNTGTGFDQNVS